MMFYKMIENARDRWYASSECTMAAIIDYIELKGMLRDAQISAIKTYVAEDTTAYGEDKVKEVPIDGRN